MILKIAISTIFSSVSHRAVMTTMLHVVCDCANNTPRLNSEHNVLSNNKKKEILIKTSLLNSLIAQQR